MKQNVLIVLLVLATVAPMEAAEPNLQGWENTRWGMTRAEVAAARPDAQDISMPDYRKPPRPPGVAFGIPEYQVGACPVRVFFEFKDDRLASVSLHFFVRRTKACFAEFRETFLKEYGAPASEKIRADSGDVDSEWLVGNTRIYLGMRYIPSLKVSGGGLTYSPRKHLMSAR